MEHARLEHADTVETALDVMGHEHVHRVRAELVERFDRRARRLDDEAGRAEKLCELAQGFRLRMSDERTEFPLHVGHYIRGAWRCNG
jgi:hypothetical protein